MWLCWVGFGWVGVVLGSGGCVVGGMGLKLDRRAR